jgi:predicted amidohydrolase
MTSGADAAANRRTAERLVRRAASEGAGLVVLPETWNLMAGPAAVVAGAEPLDGPSLGLVAGLAAELGIAIVAGSIGERSGDPQRARNTSVVFGPDGAVAGTYRKLHLFDVEVDGRAYRESATVAPGDAVCVADVGPLRVGMSICYDLRFPELYRRLADLGATVVAIPSAFTARTGRDHWDVLVRARAIEDQVFVLAAGQVGRHPDGSESYGHSMIVDPWGVVLARDDDDDEGIAVADLDLDRLAEIRAQLPALAHRRRGLGDH